MSLLDNDITVDSRPYIIELQGYLRTIQRVRQGSTTVPQDGYYGPATAEAQPPTPIAGKGSTPLVEGDRGDPVLFLNAMIGRLARVYNNILYTPPDNRYTPATAYAVRGIQEWAGLPVTGETDTATWDIITTLYNALPREALFE